MHSLANASTVDSAAKETKYKNASGRFLRLDAIGIFKSWQLKPPLGVSVKYINTPFRSDLRTTFGTDLVIWNPGKMTRSTSEVAPLHQTSKPDLWEDFDSYGFSVHQMRIHSRSLVESEDFDSHGFSVHQMRKHSRSLVESEDFDFHRFSVH
ncbi:hypothetical protein AVEN_109523-1 [Araneus ventricosus]|uniref:Uncharacterized protein n=1 Tax=Araneus ventricosus TaxID=182803 RepID=A0A4Y2LQL7_ARAVE|nr:hypothetical protein AVEN_109523-1 [Araneus ventricosus]